MRSPLYCLGVGPGDPELITVKASRILSQAEVVAYPCSKDGHSFALSIVRSYLESESFLFPISLDDGYRQAADALERFLDQQKKVVVLCEGDPMFYGSFGRLMPFLNSEISIEIIPGVTSVSLSASLLKRPLVLGTDSLLCLPATLSLSDLKSKIEVAETVAILKIGRHFNKIRGLLNDLGLLSYAFYIEEGGGPHQKILALQDVQRDTVPYFSMIVVYRGLRRRRE